MLIQSLQANIAALLKHNAIGKPDLEARLILENVAQFTTSELIKNAAVVTLSDQKVALAYEFAKKRCTGFPLAYILRYRNFWRSKFYVDERVLIPRPDTETLIELFLQHYTNLSESLNILDIGVGSGNLLISLLLEYKHAKGTGVDLSTQALDVAQLNAYELGAANRMKLLEADLFDNNFTKTLKSKWLLKAPKFNCIVSNPPYIDVNDPSVEPHVREFEPNVALFAEHNGLAFYKTIFSIAKSLLRAHGTVLIEAGHTQKDQLLSIAQQNGFSLIASKNDLAKIPRAFLFNVST